MRRTLIRTLIPLTALALLGAACTGDDDDAEPSATDELGTSLLGSAPAATEPTETEPDGTEAPEATSPGTGTAAEEVQTGGSVLDTVKANDVVRCGTRDALPGFAVLDPAGDHVGFDADFCRVVAAAVLGDATKVEFVDLETADRFTALQCGAIDVLIRNTTWTASRDGAEGATFLQPNFYDGQGMMVAADSGFAVDRGHGRRRSSASPRARRPRATPPPSRPGSASNWEVRTFDDTDQIQAAFVAGQCDGWSSRHQPAHRAAHHVPGRARCADDPARGLLEGAARSGGRRR